MKKSHLAVWFYHHPFFFFFSKEMHLIENLKSCFLVPGRQQLKTSELTLTCKTVVRILKIKFVQKAVISLQTGPRKKEPEWRGEQCYQNLSRLTYRLVSEIHTDGLGKDAQKEATVHEKFKRQNHKRQLRKGGCFFLFFLITCSHLWFVATSVRILQSITDVGSRVTIIAIGQ